MLKAWREQLDCPAVPGFRPWQLALVLALVLASGASMGSDGLRVENPGEITFAVAAMTPRAKELGLTNSVVAASLKSSLSRAGLAARQSDLDDRDSDVLFIDIVVEDETFYASLGFWRMASYRLPGGELNSELVTVWQDYSVGAHHDDAAKVRATVNRIVSRFISQYRDVNDVGVPLRVASTP